MNRRRSVSIRVVFALLVAAAMSACGGAMFANVCTSNGEHFACGCEPGGAYARVPKCGFDNPP